MASERRAEFADPQQWCPPTAQQGQRRPQPGKTLPRNSTFYFQNPEWCNNKVSVENRRDQDLMCESSSALMYEPPRRRHRDSLLFQVSRVTPEEMSAFAQRVDSKSQGREEGIQTYADFLGDHCQNCLERPGDLDRRGSVDGIVRFGKYQQNRVPGVDDVESDQFRGSMPEGTGKREDDWLLVPSALSWSVAWDPGARDPHMHSTAFTIIHRPSSKSPRQVGVAPEEGSARAQSDAGGQDTAGIPLTPQPSQQVWNLCGS